MPWANNTSLNIVRLSLLILVMCSFSPAFAQSPDDDPRELDNQQLDAFEREAANSNLTPLQIDGLEARIQNFSHKLAERLDENDILQRALQLEAAISAPRPAEQPHSETSQVPTSTEPPSQRQSDLMLVGAGLLDLLIVRRPSMAWYRRQALFIRGANSVDILFKQIFNRAVFEAFIFFLSFALVFVGVQKFKALFH
jgi:hypothetical protein